jgi:hypothetical protein
MDKVKTGNAYQKIVLSLKRRGKGATAADICAATALPLSEVQELLPKAADEYQGRLQVTQSGEILYTFPNGFTSRYRGLQAAINRFTQKGASVVKTALAFLFKAWIMVMLIGYFVLFLALAVASVFISAAARSSSDDRRGGFGGFNLFGLLWRIWFFNELTRPRYGYDPVTRKTGEKRPMHKAIFSFVFGEDDPNRDWEERESKAVIEYIQANRGVISLAEYMAFSGKNSVEAEEAILSFCSRYGGSPEVTEEGTIVYRFDDLLLRADSKNFGELSPPIKRLKTFSVNPKKLNGWFIAINAVNLLFGSYFLYNSFASGLLVTEMQYQSASYFYAFTHYLLSTISADPLGIIRGALGFVPLVFSLFFWIIPAVRRFLETKANEDIKLSNFKRLGFSKIWAKPVNVELSDLAQSCEECSPKNITAAADRVIKDMGAVSSPEIENGEDGKTFYSFRELVNEKQALQKYRESIDPARTQLGETVFDSAE